MRIRRATLTMAALAAVVVSTVVAEPARADPNVPCGSRSTYIGIGSGYYNLTFKNCGTSGVNRQPYDELYGYWSSCRYVAPGSWVSWTNLPSPAWHSNWEARAC